MPNETLELKQLFFFQKVYKIRAKLAYPLREGEKRMILSPDNLCVSTLETGSGQMSFYFKR